MNPFEAYITDTPSEEAEKTAVIGEMAMEAGRQVGMGAMLAAGASGVYGVGAAVQKAYHAIMKHHDFKSMMSANPDLQEYQRGNPQQFALHYNSLRSMNPRFASDPVVAGTYMRQMSSYPQTAGKVVVESLAGLKGMAPSPIEFGMSGFRPTEFSPEMAAAQLEKTRQEGARAKGEVGRGPLMKDKLREEVAGKRWDRLENSKKYKTMEKFYKQNNP